MLLKRWKCIFTPVELPVSHVTQFILGSEEHCSETLEHHLLTECMQAKLCCLENSPMDNTRHAYFSLRKMYQSPAFPEVWPLNISEDKLSVYVCVNRRLYHLKVFLELYWRNSVCKLSAAIATIKVMKPVFKTRLVWALSNLVQWKVALTMAGGWNEMISQTIL